MHAAWDPPRLYVILLLCQSCLLFLLSASVESILLYRHPDSGLCCGGGLLLWYSTWRYTAFSFPALFLRYLCIRCLYISPVKITPSRLWNSHSCLHVPFFSCGLVSALSSVTVCVIHASVSFSTRCALQHRGDFYILCCEKLLEGILCCYI